MNDGGYGVISCTESMEVLENDQCLGKKGLRTLFSIECQHGKLVTPHSYFKDAEREIILMPGSYFEVTGQLNPTNDLHIIHLKEIEPPHLLVKPPFIKKSSSNLSTTSLFSTTVKPMSQTPKSMTRTWKPTISRSTSSFTSN